MDTTGTALRSWRYARKSPAGTVVTFKTTDLSRHQVLVCATKRAVRFSLASANPRPRTFLMATDEVPLRDLSATMAALIMS